MRIHLLRHSDAEEISPSGLDEDRRLTDGGLARMKPVSRAISRLAPEFDLVLHSPFVRARQTAEPVIAACRFRGAVEVTRNLVPSAEPDEVLHELSTRKPKSVLLVSHEPLLGRLFARLLLGGTRTAIPMKKASLAIFETGSNPAMDFAELRAYLPPRVLEDLGR
ncbi:MAG: phosphohistidine phosphatase SixA [Acidobacteria bacterium]|nr:phosphohistidine phosphatase SixA [Acidobacteriota bacterium]